MPPLLRSVLPIAPLLGALLTLSTLLPDEVRAGHLIYKLRDPAGHAAGACEGDLERHLGPRTRRRLFDHPALAHVEAVDVPAATPLSDALAAYAADPHVEWVQQDHAHELDALPNDPFLASSGSWGQSFEDLWGAFRIRAPEAWEIGRGEGVIVAVVDTGVDYEHPDIADNVWVNPGEDLDGDGRVGESDWNGLDDDGNGFVDDLLGWDFADEDPDPLDERGHGSHVAGTVGAVADNGIGIAGIAPGARIMALKGFPREGPGRDSDLWRAVLYAARNGARVVNTSWSCSPLCPENPLAEEVVGLVHALGTVIVTSAGNALTDVLFNSPENMRETVTVSSVGHDDLPSASFTNHGWLVDVAAPGGGPGTDPNAPGVRVARRNILSLRASANDDQLFSVGEDYYRFSGTSMAAPHVSGVAALLLGARPDLDPDSVRRHLRQSAVDLLAPGHDRRVGAGRVDALGALTSPDLSDLDAVLRSPRQGAVFKPRADAVVEIRGTAAGADLSSWQLDFGLGNDPEAWHELVDSSDPVRNDVLARWAVGGLEEGAYVLRLQVQATDGTLYSEFLILSLERNEFPLLSQEGPPAARPDLDGNLLLWDSARDPADPSARADDANVFATDLRSGRHSVVSGAAGNQRFASVSRGVIGWLDDRAGVANQEIFGCRFRRRSGACREFPVSAGVSTTLPPAAALGRLFWTDARSGRSDVNACRPDRSGECVLYETGIEPASRVFLSSDGRSLAWTEAGGRPGGCRLDPRSGTCTGFALEGPLLASSASISGRLAAWVEFGFPGPNTLRICEIDPETHVCQPIDVMDGVDDLAPKLHGNRLVWDAAIGDQASDVFFCEYDAVRRRCPVQRLTAHVARQATSDVNGDWVVFEDDRAGPTQVRGIRLPSLVGPRDRRARVGRTLAIPVRSGAHSPPLELQIEAARGPSVEELGGRLVEAGRGRGVFLWRPRREHVGDHAFTFSGRTRDGLVTRRTIRVRVEPVGPRHESSRLRGL